MADAGFQLQPFQQELADTALNAGYFNWCGVRLVSLEAGSACVTFRPRPEMLTPWRSLNGAVINGLVELPSSLALMSGLQSQELPVTNDIFLQHLRPLPGDGDYVLEGRLLHRSRTMAWTEVSVQCSGKLVSLARVTKTLAARPATARA